MARKGQFKKGGGRVGGRARKRHSSKAITRYRTRTRTVTKYRSRGAHRKHRRRGSRRGAGLNLMNVGIATAGLAYLTSANSPIQAIRTTAAKIPGAATFGTPAAVGIAALAVDRFLWRNKWLKLAGVAGVVLAAAKLGEQNTSFKFIGDDDVTADIGDDDIGDDDDEVGLDY